MGIPLDLPPQPGCCLVANESVYYSKKHEAKKKSCHRGGDS